MSERVWVDPPSGYLYGFPKIYDPAVETLPLGEQWLLDNGMPWSYCGLGCRIWPVTEEEVCLKDSS